MNRTLEARLRGLLGAAMVLLAALVLLLIALGFLAAALYLGLTRVMDPAWAALLTAVAALALAGLVVLVRRLGRRRPPPPAGGLGFGLGGEAVPLGAVSALGAQIGDDTARFARAHAGKAIGLALALGFAVGVSPRLRRSLWRLLS